MSVQKANRALVSPQHAVKLVFFDGLLSSPFDNSQLNRQSQSESAQSENAQSDHKSDCQKFLHSHDSMGPLPAACANSPPATLASTGQSPERPPRPSASQRWSLLDPIHRSEGKKAQHEHATTLRSEEQKASHEHATVWCKLPISAWWARCPFALDSCNPKVVG